MTNPSASSDLQTDAFAAGNTSYTAAPGGLSISAKKRLGVSAAALLLGGGAALAFFPKSNTDPALPHPDDLTPTTLPTNAEEASTVNDDMSFETAFAAARDEVGLGGVFMWHKQAYNTFLKEEWAGLSLQQRQEYAEHVLDAKLPIATREPVSRTSSDVIPTLDTQSADPTIIEGIMGDRRVMGIDQDNDGVIDVLVIEGEDGYTYSVADTSGDEGLDTVYVYDTIKDEYVLAARLDEPVVLTSDDFNEKLEDAMSKEVVDAIMAEPTDESVNTTSEDSIDEDGDTDTEATVEETYEYEENGYGDTYVNNANVNDMDDPHQ